MSATKEKLHDVIEKEMRKLKIVNFIDKKFSEIPTQDNPAFMNKKEWDNLGEDGCILITKQDEDSYPYKNRGRYCVFRITPVEDSKEDESVTCFGLFFESHLAILFAEMASKLTRDLLPDEVNPKEEPKQEIERGIKITHVGKQETLEEVALKYFPKTNSHFDRLDEVDGNAYYRSIFKLGAKWQQEPEQFFSDDRVKILEKSIEYLLKRQERMCSEEEFLAFGKSCFYKGFEKSEKDDANCYTAFREEIGSLFEQFKKK